ncbi:hypothetical protein K1719_014794 [Acacia pycnantha]|nr:hypothetical protein K1719_014794 [Acacia pycnantha]
MSLIGIKDWNKLLWIVHPGGASILREMEERLDEMRRKSMEEGRATTGEGLDWGVLFGFGPGLTMETLVLHSAAIHNSYKL